MGPATRSSFLSGKLRLCRMRLFPRVLHWHSVAAQFSCGLFRAFCACTVRSSGSGLKPAPCDSFHYGELQLRPDVSGRWLTIQQPAPCENALDMHFHMHIFSFLSSD